MTNQPASPIRLRVRGPFWSADVDLLQTTDAARHSPLRALFLEATPRTALGQGAVLLPGTLLALVRPRTVKVTPGTGERPLYEWRRRSGPAPRPVGPGELAQALRSGDAALLLLQADPAQWSRQARGPLPELTCLGGEISLEALQPQGDVLARLGKALGLRIDAPGTREGAAGLLGRVTAHAAGLSVLGSLTLPWDDTAISAVFLLARLHPEPQGGPGFRLLVEAERLTPGEADGLQAAWGRLGAALSPRNPRSGLLDPPAVPAWATLEPASFEALPRLAWTILPWAEQPSPRPVELAPDDLSLLLSDQDPFDERWRSAAVARVQAESITVAPATGGARLELSAGPNRAAGATVSFAAVRADEVWSETLQVTGAILAFNPTATPRRLRAALRRPVPTWSRAARPAESDPLDEPALWVAMPLADGWAQVPIPNLSEQIYVDTGLARTDAPPPAPGPLQGALRLGNDAPDLHGSFPSETPWRVTITGARSARGTWVLAGKGKTLRLESVSLTLGGPDLVADGLLWLSAEPPTAANALPSLDNWVAGFFTPGLASVSGRELFPPLARLALEGLTLSRRPANDERPSSARLGVWAAVWQIDPVLLAALVERRVLAAGALEATPLAWRRHPRLPMVQALPMTQTLVPPSYPSPSRQLAPFVPTAPLRLGFAGASADDTANGASTWPRLLSPCAPAPEWRALADLPLAALSLPGLALDPMPEGAGLDPEPATGLPAQYRFDLPYTDEVQALAQVPPTPRDPSVVSPLPDMPPPEPPKPLGRSDFAEHWADLARRASLAAADAVDAIGRSAAGLEVRSLAEPHAWPVRVELDLRAYPGSLRLDNADPVATSPIELRGEEALRGLHGRFDSTGTTLRRLTDGEVAEGPFQIEAGSMAALRTPDGRFRDQRGLLRGSSMADDGLITTRANLAEGATIELTTTRRPVALGAGGAAWHLWFRDLPAEGSAFTRPTPQPNGRQEVNDPTALDREQNFRLGYEWRLRPATELAEETGQPLTLFGLQCYPLTLERVHFNGTVVSAVELIVRLQLPLSGTDEQTELSNAVRLTFGETEGALVLTAVSALALDPLAAPQGKPALASVEWPLSLPGGEAGDTPRLRWTQARIAGSTLTIIDARMHFFLFGVEWPIALPEIVFGAAGVPLELRVSLPVPPDAVVAPEQLKLSLNPATREYKASLDLVVRMGKSYPADGLQALYTFEQGGNPDVVSDVSGASPPLDLKITNRKAVRWGLDGLTITAPTIINSGPATRLNEAAIDSDELTVEAWIRPSNLTQRGPSRIVTISKDFNERNFSLQQGVWQEDDSTFYTARLRTVDLDGYPVIRTPKGSLKASLTHVVYTRTTLGEARLFLDGVERAAEAVTGTFDEWERGYALALANEIPGERAWLGTYRMVAIYNRALRSEEVAARFAAGPTSPPRAEPRTLRAGIAIDLLTAGAATWKKAQLFDDLSLTLDGESSLALDEESLRLTWRGYGPVIGEPPQLLPGMPLAQSGAPGVISHEAPGFALLAFRPEEVSGGLPTLKTTGAFLEATLLCRWGAYLQVEGAGTDLTPARLFGSSAGDLAVGYTLRHTGTGWEEAMLMNGVIEVKNLVSWPTGANFQQATAQQKLPAARPPGTPPPLNHLRHTIRVLLNQHELPGAILAPASGSTLFTIAEGCVWQLLAVVEHQLAEVRLASGSSLPKLERQARWTVVQEVHVLTPRTLHGWLAELEGARTAGADAAVVALGEVAQGLLGRRVRELLAGPDGALNAAPAGTLLVEASAPHLVRLRHVAAEAAVTLQHLPTGSQTGLLSTPEDFGPSNPATPEWLLLTMPLLGRLQPAVLDQVEGSGAVAGPLQVDPVLLIQRLRVAAPTTALPELALALAGWSDRVPLTITLAVVDTPDARRLARLDPTTVEESWFRVHRLRLEERGPPVQSILAALPNAPARLARATALRQLFDPRRAAYPSVSDPAAPLPVPPDDARPLWREGSLMLIPGASDRAPDAQPGYGWLAIGAQIEGASVLGGERGGAMRRYAAATLIPSPARLGEQAVQRPVSLAISPFLGIGWRPAPPLTEGATSVFAAPPLQLRLLQAELLCLQPATSQLAVVAGHMWEVREDVEGRDSAGTLTMVRAWAKQSLRLLAPEAQAAVLRLRAISDNTNPDSPLEAALVTAYGFELVPAEAPAGLTRRLFSLRATLGLLRFREGHYNPGPLPEAPHDFELAAPQTTGVQPVYLLDDPNVEGGARAWPWGVSALRVSVVYTAEARGVTGALAPAALAGVTLWWQVFQHNVQFRSALRSKRPAAGLPAKFRAPPIRSLMPVIPDPPLPPLEDALIEQPTSAATLEPARMGLWQPVLPGSVRYLLTGSRPGVFLAVRNQLIRQHRMPGADTKQPGAALVSGSVPVQHRAPRPVPLPPNTLERRATALQPWASFFEPAANHLVGEAPADEAFMAPTEHVGSGGAREVVAPARRLRMALAKPARGALDPAVAPDLIFAVELEAEAPVKDSVAGWLVVLEVMDGSTRFRYKVEATGDVQDASGVAVLKRPLLAPLRFTPEQGDALQQYLARLPAGAQLRAVARVRPRGRPEDDDFYQELSFVLHVAPPTAPPVPLSPRFIHFEDPEYNRRLTSPSAHATKLITMPVVDGRSAQRAARLSADRRECNPDSAIFARFDWLEEPPIGTRLIIALRIRRVERNNIVRALRLGTLPLVLTPTVLREIRLADLLVLGTGQPAGLLPGDRLELVAQVYIDQEPPPDDEADGVPQPSQTLAVGLAVIDQSVMPAPEAGYALLRRQTLGGQDEVECARFAWGPPATRVDLVNPDDLLTEVVRRRAVFNWYDTVRPDTLRAYAVQKLTPGGSTHIPPLASEEITR